MLGDTEAPNQRCFCTSVTFRKVHHSLIYNDVSTRMLPFGGKPVFVISADSRMIDTGSLSKYAMGSKNRAGILSSFVN